VSSESQSRRSRKFGAGQVGTVTKKLGSPQHSTNESISIAIERARLHLDGNLQKRIRLWALLDPGILEEEELEDLLLDGRMDWVIVPVVGVQ
jgi:hypothetical protein